jgi:hypothetical protein
MNGLSPLVFREWGEMEVEREGAIASLAGVRQVW